MAKWPDGITNDMALAIQQMLERKKGEIHYYSILPEFRDKWAAFLISTGWGQEKMTDEDRLEWGNIAWERLLEPMVREERKRQELLEQTYSEEEQDFSSETRQAGITTIVLVVLFTFAFLFAFYLLYLST